MNTASFGAWPNQEPSSQSRFGAGKDRLMLGSHRETGSLVRVRMVLIDFTWQKKLQSPDGLWLASRVETVRDGVTLEWLVEVSTHVGPNKQVP